MAKPSNEALERHDRACELNEHKYVDPDTGYLVMTSQYLMTRSHCCGSGCRHCPWPAEMQKKAGRPNVPSYPYPAADS